mmetsp:Transcript_18737/g.20366  ORF Transcript_18737/g.20366 Transcript_18737/m.20366 type:complete len:221 (+) Transcript_18737:90-752(+)|eukprot:CAMPEP_0173157920 /NCGR_PEP_ID=MMETSP1105-20130129/15966_1 /TAXON_ID=2985 /ORGANISM="Ochromonas sp., Strain BG-1" /LENGTH=220 /DNA_ID=CAMNT_0014075585 /DNA_START=67 /DNA_END=729 /DNA_ORIENTATION=+
MFKLVVLFSTLLSVWSFSTNSRMSPLRATRLQMAANDNSKWMNALASTMLVASTFIAGPALAKPGDEARIEIFGNNGASSPFYADEKREDALYSPYSPYGNGEKSKYNLERKGSAEEVKFWKGKFDESAKRVDRVPKYAADKAWFEITTELTRYTYDFREAANRVAAASSNPAAAKAAVKVYFQDIEDIYQGALKKKGDVVLASYDQSVKDLTNLRTYLK